MNTKCGLINLGNTCYMNAVLQLLIHCKPLITYLIDTDKPVFIKHLEKNIIKKHEATNTDFDICNEIKKSLTYQLYVCINDVINNKNTSYAPNIFKKVCCNLITNFNNFEQQDAMELLLRILDLIYEECKSENKINIMPMDDIIIKYNERF